MPGAGGGQRESLGPFHRHQAPESCGLLLLLGEQFISAGWLLQPVEIEVHQGRGAAIGGSAGVVLGQGEGGAGDRFADSIFSFSKFGIMRSYSLYAGSVKLQ